MIAATAVSSIGFAQDAKTNTSLTNLLSSYYNIKDALVIGDATTASGSAEGFIKLTNTIDKKAIPDTSLTRLRKSAAALAGSKDIKTQRNLFVSFSNDMIALAKAMKLADQPVYQQYCPMKKASWLSSEKAIKNPYYGSAMLTCGKVTDTY
jgi:hypothetical protein